jgi:hypothetical protein
MEGPIETVSTADLIDQITELAGHLNAAQAVDWLLQRAARTKNVSAETSADP